MTDTEFKNYLGDKIRTLRKKKGFTQTQLAEKIGYKSSGTIALIENGMRGMDQEKIFKAAEILEIPPTVLLPNFPVTEEKLDMVLNFVTVLKKGNQSRFYTIIESLLEIAAKE